MQISIRHRWWVAIFLLVTSCRSQQAAFSFYAAPVAAQEIKALPSEPLGHKPPLFHAAPALAPARPARIGNLAKLPAADLRLARRHTRPIAQLIRHQHQDVTVARPKPATDGRDTRHLVLGAVLVVAGVIAGLWLGGWLGLGIGALVVLVGYYFVVLGLGGKNAWLEVFQEFFNM